MAETAEEIEERIERRKAERQQKLDEQKAKDLGIVEKLCEEHGDDVVDYVEVERYAEGLPVLVVVRMPRSAELKRYQHMANAKKPGAALEANETLGLATLLYPDRETLTQLEDVRPMIIAAAGKAAADMAGAKVRREGKG